MKKDKEYGILFVFHYTDLNNGAVRSMVDVIENLKNKYNKNIVVFYNGRKKSAVEYLESMGIHCYKIVFGRWDYQYDDLLIKKIVRIIKEIVKNACLLFEEKRIKQIIKFEKVNLIYTNTIVTNLGAKLSKTYALPHIWHIREFGREDHHLNIFPNYKALYKCLNNNTNHIIYISNSIREQYENKIINTKSSVIYNDISPKYINPKNLINTKTNLLKACIIGSIKEGKGQIESIKAIELLKKKDIQIELHICGKKEGQYYKKIKEYVEKKDLKNNVVFDGFIRDMNNYRKEMDIGIVSSKKEAFGRVTIEGMLSMLAMIGSSSAGTKELIDDDNNGLLYKLGDYKDLANKIEKLYNDRKKMSSIAINGFKYAKENFTVGNAAKQINLIIEKTIDKEEL